MKVYIAGPINGMPDGNKAAFKEAADRVHAAGHVPVNPWDIPPNHDANSIGRLEPCCPGDPPEHEPDGGHTYGCYLRADLEVLMYCDAIMLLDGWIDSRGASTEAHVAWALGLQVVEF